MNYRAILERALERARQRVEERSGVAMERYRGHELQMAQDVFGLRPWAGQRAIFQALHEHQFVAVRGGRKVSKTHSAAAIVLAYLYSAPTIVLTTAPTGRQVKEVLWQRIGSMWEAARKQHHWLQGRRGAVRIDVAPEHFALGIASNKPDRYQGWHAGVFVPDDPDADLSLEEVEALREDSARSGVRLLVVLDEAAGIDPLIISALDASLSGGNAYGLMIANPTLDANAPHPFAQAFRPGSRWHRIRLSAVDEPESMDTAEFDEFFRAPNWLVDPTWVEEKRRQWGEDSALFAAYVAGRFPAEAEDSLIPLSLLERRKDLVPLIEAMSPKASLAGRWMGVDVSRQGKDFCCAVLVVDGIVQAVHKWKHPDLMVSAGVVIQAARKWGVEPNHIGIDVGMGAGMIDRLRQLKWNVRSVDFGAGPVGDWSEVNGGEMKFMNRRVELYFTIRNLLTQGLLSIPRGYSTLWQDLAALSYGWSDRRDVLEITPKSALQASLGRSPDDSDALCCAIARGSRKAEPGVGVI